MRTKPFILLAATVFATAAGAQAESDVPYDGRWTATIQPTDGKRQVSQLVLRNFGGTWQGTTAGAKAVCKSRQAPITVQESTASTLAFTVWGKTAGAECRDLTIVLKPVTEKELEGTVESVGTIKLVRR